MSIQCFWHGLPDSHLEFGPAVVWPHESSNGDFRIHMQNGWSDLGLCIFFKPFCTFQPRVALHVACRSARTQGGLMKFAPAIGLYFLQAMVSCIVGCAFFLQQFKIVFDASILCKRDGLKTHEGALQFISGRFGLNFGIQNFHL